MDADNWSDVVPSQSTRHAERNRIESELNKRIRRSMWNDEKNGHRQPSADVDNACIKVLVIEARNKAMHVTWLKDGLANPERR